VSPRRLRAALRNDVRLQWRQGFYGAYLLLTVLYVLILRQIPEGVARWLTPLVIFSDPAVVGFFFIGGVVLLERADRTLDALFVTPLRVPEYLLAKIGSLGAMAVATSLLIALGAGLRFRPVPLLLGITLTASLAVLAGIALVSRFESLNRFAWVGGLAISLFSLPLLAWFGVVGWGWVAPLPTAASVALIGGAFGEPALGPAGVALGTAWLLAWNLAAWLWARRWFGRYVVGAARGEEPDR
jgi:fluoroquinolone transport system permease protein